MEEVGLLNQRNSASKVVYEWSKRLFNIKSGTIGLSDRMVQPKPRCSYSLKVLQQNCLAGDLTIRKIHAPQ